ncbi:MAG: EAL domain-containing protein [Thermodesulfobacteriota bacterium]
MDVVLSINSQTFSRNVDLMRSRASRYAIYGVSIALAAILIATLLSDFVNHGSVSVLGMYHAQKENYVLWVLDALPFIFAFWGQYVSALIAHEASTMVSEQTEELRRQTADLEMKVMHDSTHDHLTGLPNRSLLLDRMQQGIALAKRAQDHSALLLLDLDHFKEVNDALGHYHGDLLLKQVSIRLKNALRPSDTVARLGGDEFGVFISSMSEEKSIDVILTKIKKVFATPFTLKEDIALNVKCSTGVALYPEHGQDVDTLVQRADIAMYVAKNSQRDYLVYSPKIDQHSSRRLTLMAELSHAIDNGELRIYFQPKVSCRTGKVEGAEALVRWQHAKFGLIPPDQFIPMAERTGIIGSLTTWVLKATCEALQKWYSQGLFITASVNISPQTLLDPEFPETLTGLLAAVDLPKDTLVLEITETSVMKDPDLALSILFRLREMGIKISIDDFGTGYSSLSYLREMPVSEIKIDKSFVMEMLSNEKDAVIVKATIDLAHNLGLQVVAEGVEERKVALRLNGLGCDLIQGFLFSKPLSDSDFMEWQTANRAMEQEKTMESHRQP